MTRRVAVALVVAVAVAGCVGVPPATGGPDTAEVRGIEVRGGSLPVDANATFDRVANVLPGDPPSPGYVRVLTDDDLPSRNRSNASGGADRSFGGLLGVVPEPDRRGTLPYRYPASTTANGVVTVYPGEKPPGLTEVILAHEYVHYVQFRRRHLTRLREQLPATTDGTYVVRAVLEGTAVVATDTYARRYVAGVDSNSQLYERIEAVTPPGTPGRYANSWYAFGADYVAARTADGSDLGTVVDTPPTTSEQVIHGYAPGEEPARSLSVTVADGGEWRTVGTDTKGEAFLRIALQNGLTVSRADRAAAGWGNDSLRILRRNGTATGVGYAWTIRWDDATNATEFVDGFRRYLDARGNRSDGAWTVDGRRFDVRRPTAETTVVLVGTGSFVAGTAVDAEDGTVTVTPPS